MKTNGLTNRGSENITKFIGTYQSLFIFSAQLKLFNTLKRKNEKLN
jgi:hypothetical protein